jgi:glycine/D-amino acid oxidase-like deaminating enzyme
MPSAVVVGAGVFGSALARQLALDGLDVTLVEQESPAWSGSSSSGESRLFRWSHGTERWYVRSVIRARELWREIDPRLLVDRGVAWFAHSDHGWEADSERVLREEGVAVERLDPADAARLFPSLAGDDLAWVLFEPDAGVLRAHAAVGVLAAQAQEAGVRVVRARAEPDGGRVRAGDAVLEADHVVWACGAWLPGRFGELISLRITQQDVLFFGAGAAWETPGVPGWVDYDGAFYGLGDLDGRGVKLSPDVEGPPIDVQAADRVVLPEHVEAARAYLAHRFPALDGAPLVGTRVCQYEITPDTRFVIAPHPEHGSVWLMGGGSGHGFKHGPALAERMSAWLTGAEGPEPRFAFGARSAGTALRTAGEAGSATSRS